MQGERMCSLSYYLVVVSLVVLPGLAAAGSGLEAAPPNQPNQEQQRVVPITVGGKTIQAHVADTDASRRQGLLGWRTITDETGMLLDFAREGAYAIHMQTMKFPIDAIWIDGKGQIKLIYEDIPPNSGQVYPSMFPCRYCLEVKAGFCKKYGVRTGQTVNFSPTEQ